MNRISSCPLGACNLAVTVNCMAFNCPANKCWLSCFCSAPLKGSLLPPGPLGAFHSLTLCPSHLHSYSSVPPGSSQTPFTLPFTHTVAFILQGLTVPSPLCDSFLRLCPCRCHTLFQHSAKMPYLTHPHPHRHPVNPSCFFLRTLRVFALHLTCKHICFTFSKHLLCIYCVQGLLYFRLVTCGGLYLFVAW